MHAVISLLLHVLLKNSLCEVSKEALRCLENINNKEYVPLSSKET